MKINILWGGQPLRIAVGIMMLVLILASGVNATKIINDNATGGDCKSFGTWNIKTKTCTMTKDLTEGIQIDSNSITLNGNGHTVTGNKMGTGVYLSSRTSVTIKNLNVKQFITGISLIESNHNYLIGNNASSNTRVGISTGNSNYNMLSGNIVSYNKCNACYGIILGYSNNNTLNDNNINSNGIECGVCIMSSNNNTLKSNNILNNGQGIWFRSSNYNILNSNNISYNWEKGIAMDVPSSHNIMNDNNISNNGMGISIGPNDNYYNTISGNIISNNNVGISLGLFNNIYNNHFNNTINLIIHSGDINIWNTTKTPGTNVIGGSYLGGNFWAYPNGTGFSQTCTDANKDGICDNKYTLDRNNIDYLPLAYKPATPIKQKPQQSNTKSKRRG